MIKARRTRGSQFTQDDVLEITYTGTEPLSQMTNSIEIVSGVGVTHGGGAPAGDFLNFKKEGDTDFSSLEMVLSQTEQGSSVIKVLSKSITEKENIDFTSEAEAWALRRKESLDSDPNKEEYESWFERKQVAEGVGEEFTEASPVLMFDEPSPVSPVAVIYKTNEITVSWEEDIFV